MKIYLSGLWLFISGFCFSQKNINNLQNSKTNILTCSNWLKLTNNYDCVKIGDLDVTGNKITVEANFNAIDNYGSIGITTDLVSKHTNPSDCNYLLRPQQASIITDKGFFLAATCDHMINKTYHVAFVYDGTSLKFYRDGYLMSQVPASGNLLVNNLITTIGNNAGTINGTTKGFINEVRIWNIARTQDEIRTYMYSSLPNPTTQPGLLAYYTFDDLLNKQGNGTWNGSLIGSAAINQVTSNCSFIADSCGIPCTSNSDFSIEQNVCDPLSVKFSDAGTNVLTPYWDFGDGTNVYAANPVHVYTAPGNYQVKHSALNGSCGNSVVKIISVAVIKDDIILTPDTIICSGSSKQLKSVPSLNFCWSPTTFLNDPNSPNPITSTPQNITYYLNAEVTGNNIIMNGDFNNGNIGFSSDYIFANPNITEGQYFVGQNPQAWNASLSSCKDHTTGSGNMLLVNGAPTPNVWKETISVTPNTNYAFSTWVQALWPPNPAQLQFSINGKTVGNLITASLPTCTWTQFYTTWNSGNNTSATISIVNKNTQIQGNDFALDDISFAPVFIKRDSVKITVDKPFAKTNNDTIVCSGTSIQLNTIGASTYSWTPVVGLSNPNIPNPVASIINPVTYIVTGNSINGCSAKDTVSFTTFPKPVITKSNDTALCKSAAVQLFVTGGNSYLWFPSSTLSNPNIANPIASPTSTTTYLVTITDGNSCAYKDSIKLTVRSSTSFSISPDQNVCTNDPKQLVAAGGNSYLWQPANFLDNPNISNPVSTPVATTTYTVKIKDNTCNDSTLLTTTLTVLPLPSIKAIRSNDIDCTNNFSQLSATGGGQYIWQPGKDLNDSTSSNPIARPLSTTLFIVRGSDINGCKNTDTVTVNVGFNNTSGYFMPTAFTPNGDGINDCFGLKYWGNVTELDFSIYNRFGERVFHSTNSVSCWDGRYKGQLQETGAFVYMIKAKTTCGSVDKKGTVFLVR
jgi:gliding motility-associated-like protein